MAKFQLPALPYAYNALKPYISEEIIEFHYGKHHQTYVDNLNKLIEGTEFASMELEDIIKKSQGGIFNNAAQTWNHTFYWTSLCPNGGGEPDGKLSEAINKNFGSFAAFKEKFTAAAVSLFGSGWAWLVENKEGGLEIVQTSNAGNPLCDGKKPLLVCDVWEHAYYIDQRNKRAAYVEAFWNIVDWKSVAARM